MRTAAWMLVLSSLAVAQEPAPLVVAVRESPPFAMQDTGGNWEGLSVDLWQDVADKLDLTFDWREMPLKDSLDALQRGDIDVAAVALTITAERERSIDFSHPYYVSGLSLGYHAGGSRAWLATLRSFVSTEFLSAVGTLILVLLIAGVAVWLFERRRNAADFGGGKTLRGLADGFWWSAVTMTTVGYGDKAPKTVGGRLVALVWMFASLIIIAGLTASIAASLTANRLQSDMLAQQPLSQLRVAVVEGTSADEFATAQGARLQRYPTLADALTAVQQDRAQVVLHDAPILKYHARTEADWLRVAPNVLVRDDYGFGLPTGSPLRERVNEALLSILHEPVWQDIQRRYLGEADEE